MVLGFKLGQPDSSGMGNKALPLTPGRKESQKENKDHFSPHSFQTETPEPRKQEIISGTRPVSDKTAELVHSS